MTGRCDSFAGTSTPSLTRDVVAAATLDLIDQRGLHAATMRAIADRLGVRAQSLYTYIDNREDLLDAVANRIVGEVDSDPAMQHAVSGPWQLYLTTTAHAVRRYAHQHPSAFVLLATRPARPAQSKPQLLSHRWVTSVRTVLQRSGFTDDDVTFAYRAFDAFLLGSLLVETRDVVIRAATASETCLRTISLPAHRPANIPSLTSTTHQHDDDFAADLDDVIDRIATRVEHTHSARHVGPPI